MRVPIRILDADGYERPGVFILAVVGAVSLVVLATIALTAFLRTLIAACSP